MTRKDCTREDLRKSATQYLADDPEFVRQLVQDTLNAALEAEMTEFLGAGKSERKKNAPRLPFRILPARPDDEGWRDRALGSAGTRPSLGTRGLSAASVRRNPWQRRW